MLLIGYRQIHEDKVKNKYLNYYIYVWKRNRSITTFNEQHVFRDCHNAPKCERYLNRRGDAIVMFHMIIYFIYL